MKKNFVFTLLIIFSVLVGIKIVYAAGLAEKLFGGKIIHTKATEIQSLEASGWTCVVPGTSIAIKPIKGPVDYFIPLSTTSETKKKPATRKLIMGKYSGKTTITCTRICPPAFCTTTVTLDTVTYFGTS